MDFEPSEDQLRALDAIDSWIDRPGQQVMTLGGLAGTGKTSLIKEIIRHRRRARVCAFTGKAAYVLRSKGVSATTIHGLIYGPIEVCKMSGEPVNECGKCRPIPCRSTEVDFRLVPEVDAKLIVVDEASMVNFDLYRDLLSFKIKVLFVGDHGQLEPIGGNPRLMSNPQIRLEQIHRQAADSPIIRFAHHVRSGRRPATFGEAARVVQIHCAPDDVASYDAVLCGKNATRIAVNERIRRDLGFAGELPSPGEKVICLKNNRIHKIFNGLIATVVSIEEDPDGDGILMTAKDEVGEVYPRMPIEAGQFGNDETLKDVSSRKTLWDFGYAFTVHKSQGSEFPRVCVLEWIHRDWGAERWRYTAATRASEELVYCVNPRRT